MSFSPIAKYAFKRLTDISPEFMSRHGLHLLLLDLDNTVAPYHTPEPDERTVRWAEAMKKSGVKLFFVSNNKSDARVRRFAEAMGTGFIHRAFKPSPRGVLRSMELCGFKREETALAGDQSYTDVLAANLAGVTPLLVQPVCLKNPLLAARYVLELPFRIKEKEYD